jgi:phage protein D
MRKARLLSTVAATMLLTVAVASAQTMKKDEAPAPAPAAQQKAPAEKIAPAIKPGAQNTVAPKAHETTGQAPKASDADKPKATDKGAMDKGKGPAIKGSSDANVGGNMKPKANENAQAPAGTKSSQTTTSPKAGTTGQGAAAGSAKLTPEQHTKITTVFKQHRVEPAHLNISVSVGARVPETVHFYPIPTEVIVIYPQWRGYDYIMVGNQIIVIDPRSHEIVAVLDA